MSLSILFVRDGKQQVIGSVTTGFSDSSSVVRDNSGNILAARGATLDSLSRKY